MFCLAVTMRVCDEPTRCSSSYDNQAYIISLGLRGGLLAVTCQIKCDSRQSALITSEMPDWLIRGHQFSPLVCVNKGKLVYKANWDPGSKYGSEFCCNYLECNLIRLYIYLSIETSICTFMYMCHKHNVIYKKYTLYSSIYHLEMLWNMFHYCIFLLVSDVTDWGLIQYRCIVLPI